MKRFGVILIMVIVSGGLMFEDYKKNVNQALNESICDNLKITLIEQT